MKIIEENTSSIMRICSIYSDEVYRSKDLFQEVLLHLWKSLDGYKNESKTSTWVYRVTLNTCLTIRKTQRKKQTTSLSDHVLISEKNEDSKDYEGLFNCIKKLPEADRAIVALYLEGLAYTSIAELLGMKENTVAVKMKRIKNKLYQCLQHERYSY